MNHKQKLRVFLSPLFFLLLGGSIASSIARPLVYDEKTAITYRGSLENGNEHFQNIKYAHDTSGRRRFAPPEPYFARPHTEVDASTRGAACPQLAAPLPPFLSAEPEVSEDCLTLRIARPSGCNITSESKLPVLVWIHGGGVVKGSAYDAHTNPDQLLYLSKLNGQPVIFAAINYRLTIFGFAHSSSLRRDKSENVGMRDQLLALQWLKDHIAAFGGDASRITVYGLSAGGTFISDLHVAFEGERGVPFAQAYTMSGPPGVTLNSLSENGVKHTQAVAAKLECGIEDDEEMMDCLRAASMETLLTAAMDYSVQNNPPNGLFTFIPEVDGDIMPDRPSKLMRQGKFAKGIPCINAWTQDDGAMSVGPANLVTNETDIIQAVKRFAPLLEQEHYENLLALYSEHDFATHANTYNRNRPEGSPAISVHFFRAARLLRDVLFTCSSLDSAHQMVRHTRLDGDKTFNNVRVYELNQSVLNPIWNSVGFDYIGAAHGSDTNYIFNGVYLEGKLTKADRALANEFASSIIQFAYTGNPVSTDAYSQTFESWPEAFDAANVDGDSDGDQLPASINVQVVGGPFGTHAVSIGAESQAKKGAIADELQNVMGGVFKYGAMGDGATHDTLADVMRQAKLHQRCNYINSLGDWLQN